MCRLMRQNGTDITLIILGYVHRGIGGTVIRFMGVVRGVGGMEGCITRHVTVVGYRVGYTTEARVGVCYSRATQHIVAL